MRFDIYNPYSNVAVTDYYVSVMERALQSAGHQVIRIPKLKKDTENEGIVVVYAYDCYRAKRAGYKKVFLWIQGLTPEESFMRNRSILRKAVLAFREYLGIRNADAIVMVSSRMRRHYEEKYHLKFDDRVFLMPCYNSELDESAFFTPEKYTGNTFCYAGGLAVWQCFEETVRLYKYVEDRVDNARLEVYTPDLEAAERILKANNVKRYSLDFVSQEELARRMKSVKYGFVLRDDTIVNNVATPTKFSSYMSSGLIPIFSRCVDDFYQHTLDYSYVLALNGFDLEENGEKIIQMCRQKISPDSIWKEYQRLFNTYYSTDRYIKQLKTFFEQHLKG